MSIVNVKGKIAKDTQWFLFKNIAQDKLYTEYFVLRLKIINFNWNRRVLKIDNKWEYNISQNKNK